MGVKIYAEFEPNELQIEKKTEMSKSVVRRGNLQILKRGHTYPVHTHARLIVFAGRLTHTHRKSERKRKPINGK